MTGREEGRQKRREKERRECRVKRERERERQENKGGGREIIVETSVGEESSLPHHWN